MPECWALRPDGSPTVIPGEALDGPLLPIGGYKGYGLSLVTDVLAGVMTGALFGRDVFQDDVDFGRWALPARHRPRGLSAAGSLRESARAALRAGPIRASD